MTVRSRDFKSPASTDFAIGAVALPGQSRGWPGLYKSVRKPARRADSSVRTNKKPRTSGIYGAFHMEAEVGIEPAFTDLQSGA